MIITFSVDDPVILSYIEKAKENGNFSQYMRQCIRRYEENTVEDPILLILKRFDELEKRLSNGVVIKEEKEVQDINIIEDILGQFDDDY